MSEKALAFQYPFQVAQMCIPDVHNVLIFGISHAHDVLIVIAERHSSPLPPLNFISELSGQLQGGFIMEQSRALLGHLQVKREASVPFLKDTML